MNIESVRKKNLCIQCGMCSAMCPLRCIAIRKMGNNYLPYVDKNKCVDCGICYKVCSVNALSEYDGTPVEDFVMGKYLKIYHASTKNHDMLFNATSGGVATTLISSLLHDKKYDCAFVVDGYSYDKQLKTKKIDGTSDFSKTQKSRYLTVSHCDAAKYIVEHPDQRVILIGTGCIISSFTNIIKLRNLSRDNYLLLGLFCDKTMNYGVYEYFKQHPENRGRTLKELFFRSKEVGGWPGGVKMTYVDDSFATLDRTERMKLKEYFVPEKCLYCLNKLNKHADISLGDNYIENTKFDPAAGSNSVIIRTELGQSIWESYKHLFEFEEDTVEKLQASQHLASRKQQLAFAGIKGLLDIKSNRKYKKQYRKALRKIRIGNGANMARKIDNDLNHNNIFRRIKHWFKGILNHK